MKAHWFIAAVVWGLICLFTPVPAAPASFAVGVLFALGMSARERRGER